MALSNWAPTRDELKSNAAATTRVIDDFLDRRVQRIHGFLFATPDADLISAYGFTQDEINNLKAAYARLLVLRNIYLGTATLASPEDFRTFPSRIWGLGLP